MRIVRSLGWIAAGILLILVIGFAGLYLVTEQALRVQPVALSVTLPTGDAAEGARLARVMGCTGCHGSALAGQVFAEIPYVARIIAPNLTKQRAHYDADGFVRLMRSGAKADGQLALVMPNKAFQRLRDDQLADLFAYLQRTPAVDSDLPERWIGPLARLGMVLGQYDLEVFRADAPESAAILADRMQEDAGRHLLQTACSECHGLDLAGDLEHQSPSLAILRAYDTEALVTLMRQGTTLAGTDSASGFMSAVARHRFAVLRDDEIAAMKAVFPSSNDPVDLEIETDPMGEVRTSLNTLPES